MAPRPSRGRRCPIRPGRPGSGRRAGNLAASSPIDTFSATFGSAGPPGRPREAGLGEQGLAPTAIVDDVNHLVPAVRCQSVKPGSMRKLRLRRYSRSAPRRTRPGSSTSGPRGSPLRLQALWARSSRTMRLAASLISGKGPRPQRVIDVADLRSPCTSAHTAGGHAGEGRIHQTRRRDPAWRASIV